MTGYLGCWINKVAARRRDREEFAGFLAAYFSGDINEDDEIVRAVGLTSAAMSKLRREFEE